MKIQLALHGGIYGKLLLQPIETDDDKIAFPEDLLTFIESSAFKSYKEQANKNNPVQLAKAKGIRTESETYRLDIFYTPRRTYDYSFQSRHSELMLI